jgi:curli biogenesis system outer membrane secretion channel CsgG
MRLLGFAGVVFAASAGLAQDVPRKRVAVFDFDNAAAQGGTTMIFFQSTPPNVGKAAAELLVTRLVRGTVASVIERSALDKLLAEQNLSNSDRTDPTTAARLGRILGVDGIILGTITHYDYEDKTTGGGGNRALASFGHGSTSTKHDLKARVQISARLVSPDTAEVLSAVEGRGEIEKKNVKVDMRDAGRVMMAGNGAAANLPIMNEAMDNAVNQLAAQLEGSIPKLPPRSTVIEALVADATEAGRIILNVGSRGGLKQGDRLVLWRRGKEIRDPANGKILLRDDRELGEVVVTQVTENAAFAAYRGTETVRIGDVAKSAPPQP